MQFPTSFKYTRDHEWISADSGHAKIGVSAYAVEQLGDIVHVELPKEGQHFQQGESFGTIESTKTVSDVYIPVTGKVVKVNSALVAHPERLQENPHEEWLIEVAIETGNSELLSSTEYEAFIAEEH